MKQTLWGATGASTSQLFKQQSLYFYLASLRMPLEIHSSITKVCTMVLFLKHRMLIPYRLYMQFSSCRSGEAWGSPRDTAARPFWRQLIASHHLRQCVSFWRCLWRPRGECWLTAWLGRLCPLLLLRCELIDNAKSCGGCRGSDLMALYRSRVVWTEVLGEWRVSLNRLR